jgi:flagellar hook-length control protein FliK
MMNSPAMLIAADPAIVEIAGGGAPSLTATNGISGSFSQTLGALRAATQFASGAVAPQTPAANPVAGQPVAATLAAQPGETIPPGLAFAAIDPPITAPEMPLAIAPAGLLVPTDMVEGAADEILGDGDSATESAGDAPLESLIANELPNAGQTPGPLRELSAFLHQVTAERGVLPDAELPRQPELLTAAANSTTLLSSNDVHARVEAALTTAAGKPQVSGVESGILLRPDIALASHAALDKGGDAVPRETTEPTGLVLSDLVTRDGAPRLAVADSRDAGMLAPNRPGFADALGQRIAWFARNDGGNARLELDPPHLGPLEVSVRVDRGEASITFVAPHASVREAVSHALPELRSLFAQSGLSLGDVNVSAGNAGQHAFASPYHSPFGRPTDHSTDALPMIPAVNMRQGLVDLYA